MKRYVPIIIGIVALCAVLYVGTTQMSKDDELANKEQQVPHTTITGKVTRVFEGENTLDYSFDIGEIATTTVGKDGALVTVTENGDTVTAVYFSYEGGRGYTPNDYITNVIVPNVKAVNETGTTTIGGYDWTTVESEWSVWHIAPSTNGQWLMVVENKKVYNDKAEMLLSSIANK